MDRHNRVRLAHELLINSRDHVPRPILVMLTTRCHTLGRRLCKGYVTPNHTIFKSSLAHDARVYHKFRNVIRIDKDPTIGLTVTYILVVVLPIDLESNPSKYQPLILESA
jgi:hypothetical protein